MSILALESVYELDEELREESKKQFRAEHEVLTLLNMEHGLKDIKFREEYIKEVKKNGQKNRENELVYMGFYLLY